MEAITNLRQSFAAAPAEVRNQIARQFEPLVNKIVSQWHRRLKTDWYTLKSMAYEGLTIAMNTYDPERSQMNFTQFAAFAMLNNIRNCSCTELHTVKLTSYTQEQIKKTQADVAADAEVCENAAPGIGATTFTTVSISAVMNPAGDNENMNREMRYGVYESAKFEDGDPMELLKTEVDTHCNATDAYCFYSFFGVCGVPEKQVTELAAELNVTSGRISQRIKKVLDYIKSNEDICEAMASLLEK
jgi:hypothetical protein